MFFQASELLSALLTILCMAYFCLKCNKVHWRDWLIVAEKHILDAATFALGIYAILFFLSEIARGIIQFFCMPDGTCVTTYNILQLLFPDLSTTMLIVIGLGSLKMINEGLKIAQKIGNRNRIPIE